MIDITISLTERERALLAQLLNIDEIKVFDVILKHGDDGVVQMYLGDELRPMRSTDISKVVIGLIQKKFVVKEMTKAKDNLGNTTITNQLHIAPGARRRITNIVTAVCDIPTVK